MSVLVVIPARYASTRYPGKPLVALTGATGAKRSLIERTWRAAKEVADVDRVVIATDDARIEKAARAFGAEVVQTSPECRNGTERCAEAYRALSSDADIVVNFQGDAPLTPPWFIADLVAGLKNDASAEMSTPVIQCDGDTLSGLLEDRRAGRVGGTTAVFDGNKHALYFSKEVIPFVSESYEGVAQTPVFHHVGVYAFRPPALLSYPTWEPGPLESLEGLEQLRFLENGRKVLCVPVHTRGRQFWELNNPSDVKKLESMMETMGIE